MIEQADATMRAARPELARGHRSERRLRGARCQVCTCYVVKCAKDAGGKGKDRLIDCYGERDHLRYVGMLELGLCDQRWQRNEIAHPEAEQNTAGDRQERRRSRNSDQRDTKRLYGEVDRRSQPPISRSKEPTE